MIRVEEGSTVLGQYFYDGLGRRVKKVASGITTHYHYDQEGNLISETSGTGDPLRDYIYQNGERIAVRIYGAQTETCYYLNDHLGTPQKIVDESGTVVWQAVYLPFGEAQVLMETIVNNFRLPGQYLDAETGLHYNYLRYYDPSTGRYLTPDPIGLEGGINLFAYVQNNPVLYTDPYGLVRWGAVFRGSTAMIAGGLSVWGGSIASTTGLGAIVGVPAAIGGSATFGWGTSEFIAGLLDSETDIATPSTAALGTLITTGDMSKAKNADMVQDIVTLGVSGAKVWSTPPNTDMLSEVAGNLGDFVYVVGQGANLECKNRGISK